MEQLCFKDAHRKTADSLSLSCPVSSFAHARIRPDSPPETDVYSTINCFSNMSNRFINIHHVIEHPTSVHDSISEEGT